VSRARGHIADRAEDVEDDDQRRRIGMLIGAAPTHLPERVDYSALLATVPDQGNTSSCVGQAFATSVYLRARIAGTPIARPSAKAIYDIARLLDAPRSLLEDRGARPRAAIAGMMTFGIVSDERWPLTELNVNALPSFDVIHSAIDARVSGYYRIASGAGCAATLRQALAKGFCPAFAMEVDESYEGISSSEVYTGPTGPLLGGHMQTIVGYAPGRFVIAGSWGPSFARGGFACIDESFFERGLATDILVPTVVPPKVT
jgi:hypothetical protein